MFAFSGKFLYTVDVKGRVNVPAPYRSQLSAGNDQTFHIAYGPNECLFVYPQQIFIQVATRLEEEYGSLATPDEERRYLLDTMASAQPSRCDQQGRIIVPQEHLDYAHLTGEVLIIGVLNRMEFWNPKLYHAFMEDSELNKKQRVQRFGGADRVRGKEDV